MPIDSEQAIQVARNLLPAWVTWAPLVIYPAAAVLVSLFCCWLGQSVGLMALRGLPASAPWPEVARCIHPARFLAVYNLSALPILIGVGVHACSGRLWVVPPRAVVIVSAFAAFLCVWWINLRRPPQIVPRPITTRRSVWGSLAFLWFMMYPHLALALIWAEMLPDRMNLVAGVALAVYVAAVAFLLAGGAIWICRGLGLVRPASEKLSAAVNRAVERAGVVPRGVYELSCTFSGAFAFWGSRQLIFTEICVAETDEDELEAVCLHELAHLREPRAALAARIAGVLLMLPFAAIRPIIGSFGVFAFLACFIASQVAARWVRRIARQMEEQADAAAHGAEAAPGTFARAIEKVYRANLEPVVTAGDHTLHPDLYDRLLAAGVTPDYARPEPPSVGWRRAALAATYVPLALCFLAWNRLPFELPNQLRFGEECDCLALSIRGSDSEVAAILGQCAERQLQQGDSNAAQDFWRAATVLDEHSPLYPAALAISLAAQGQCHEAEQSLRIAQERHTGFLFQHGMSSADDKVVRHEHELIIEAMDIVASCGRD